MNRVHEMAFGIPTRLTIAILLLLAGAAGASDQPLRKLSGHVPAAVHSLQPMAAAAASDRLRLAIGFPLRNQAELQALLAAQQNPSSPQYRRFLTPEQFTERFGPTAADYKAVEDFAVASGLTVTARHANRIVLDVGGAAPDVGRAFGVTLNRYQHPTEARTFIAPDAEPSVAADLNVLHIAGLSDFARPRPLFRRNPAARIKPRATNGSGPSSNYMGSDFRNAYVPGSPLTGSGQTVGLLQYDGYDASDVTYYYTRAGIAPIPLNNVLIDGATGAPSGDGGEVEVCLDIQMVASMAPGVSAITCFIAPNPSPWVDLLNSMAAHPEIKQFSCSWGGGDPDPTAEAVFQQMQAQGQSFFNATGDSDAFSASNPIEFPSDSTNITQVGATTLTMSGAGASYVSETVWQWGDDVGSSGGVSTNYGLPSWQQGISMVTNKGSTAWRNLPDVAAVGDDIYVRADATDQTGTGGTSCAAPLWAGFMALVNQQAASNGLQAVGFLNPALYTIGKSTLATHAFHDITTGNNTNSSSKTKYYAVAGYDLCTGWGTPNGTNLIAILASPGGGISNQPPFITAVASVFAVESNLVEFPVIASDPVDRDTITLTVSNCPPWATFPAAVHAASVTNAFTGTPTNAGSYVVTFLATDKDGTTSQDVSIRVVPDIGGVPVIDPIPPLIVPVSNQFQFAVHASDPSNVDAVVLSAIDLPAWASFPAVTNRPSVTNLFVGTPTETGTVAVTFVATDRDGVSNLTVSIRVIQPGPSTNMIDENFDGGLTAPGGWTFTAIGGTYTTAGNYGRKSPSLKFDATGDRVLTPLFSGGTNVSFWIKGQGTDASSSLLVEALLGSTWNTLATIQPLPMTGTAESAPLDRAMTQIRFTYTKSSGNMAFDDVIVSGDAGSAPLPTPPVLAAIAPKSVAVGGTLQFAVTATPTDGDAVTLTMSNAPASATFEATNAAGMFTWPGAGPAGTYTPGFYAIDKDGTVSTPVTITVTSGGGGGSTGTNLLVENFDSTTGVPAGWVSTNSANDTAASHYHSAPNCRSLPANTVLITPAVNGPTQLVFYADCSNSGNAKTGAVDYAVAGGDWIPLSTFVVGTSGAMVTNDLSAAPGLSATSNVQFRFRSSFNTWYLDDVSVTGGAGGGSGGVVDTNTNGVDDAWELVYFGDLSTFSADSDHDFDGFSDLNEYLAGTDPTNATSRLEALSSQVSSGAVYLLSWQSASNRIYTVDRSTNWTAGFGVLANNIPATPPVNVYTDDAPPGAAGFYRVRLGP
jgi:hypothetical protein